jgi:hypothetical protein
LALGAPELLVVAMVYLEVDKDTLALVFECAPFVWTLNGELVASLDVTLKVSF